MSKMQPPKYYSKIFEKTNQRWIQLEGDPELAAPWKQLFDQVQSPRHVVSELLQNADDVGASEVSTGIVNNQFYFKHNGKDFSEDEFSSLCRFGYSNKRKLHTIGFRGIGFKSTFSIGEPVQVFTPTLAVEFYKKRFTLPNWIENGEFVEETKISVPIQDNYSKNDLSKNLKEWTVNPVSLLFFNSIQKLTIGSIHLQRRIIGRGPTRNSKRIQLWGADNISEVLLFSSKEEQFPKEAIDEIRRDRNLEDNNQLPFCHVDVLLGLQQEQRAYVVLPTGISLNTPFSCNAPFIQDPARFGIKAPSLSPTNRWLLYRIGKLAAEEMLEWLSDDSLSFEQRSEAYNLIPGKAFGTDNLESSVNDAICQGFNETIHNRPFLLTTSGELVNKRNCIVPPLELYEIWTPEQILQVFGKNSPILSGNIKEINRKKLESWQHIETITVEKFFDRLKTGNFIPKPNENIKLLKLWNFVQENVGFDYYVHRRRELAIIPVKGINKLFPYSRVVRIPYKKEFINDESWDFLLNLIDIIDPEWLRYINTLEKKIDKGDETAKSCISLYRELGISSPSDTSSIIKNAASKFFSNVEPVSIADCVKLSHLMAALDAKTPENFYFVSNDGYLRETKEEIIVTENPNIDELLPFKWREEHILHNDYFNNYDACSKIVWRDWTRSEKCDLWPTVPIKTNSIPMWYIASLYDELRKRNTSLPFEFPYKTEQFRFIDYDFEKEIVASWEKGFKSDPEIWAKVVSTVLESPVWYWKNHMEAYVKQIATTKSESKVNIDPIPSAWILRFRELPCLYDNFGKPRYPSELYMRSPDTEPFLGVEPFVKAEYDNDSTKPLLRILGVREKPTDVKKIVERIRALIKAPNPISILSTLINWYKALDRALMNSENKLVEDIKNIFITDSLILTAENTCARSKDIFIYSSEDYPEANTVHPAVNNLNLWIKVGVASQPTSELILDWISNLPSDKVLEQDILKRVKLALQRYPTQVWDKCQHWLAIDNSWRSTVSFEHRMTMQSLTKYAELFPPVKSKCANFQMLGKDLTDNNPFVTLPDLETRIEYRLTKEPNDFQDSLNKPLWINILGNELKRIKIDEEEQKKIIIHNAERLENSFWLIFNKTDSLQVSPFIDNTPVGTPQERSVLWYDKHIFVKEGGYAKFFNEIIQELARPFCFEKLTEAFKACIFRDESFIKEYMNENFTLVDGLINKKQIPVSGTPLQQEETPNKGKLTDKIILPGIAGVGINENGDENESSESEGQFEEESNDNEDLQKRHHKRKTDLFERYAISQDFRWDPNKSKYVNHDGSWIEKSFPPFMWKLKERNGSETDFWVSTQCLQRTGIEIPSELWNRILHYPQTISLILTDEAGNPYELPGRKLTNWNASHKIELYSSKYRISLV